jgi:hypothetical protein
MAVKFKRSIEVGILGHKERKIFHITISGTKKKKMHNRKVAIPYNLINSKSKDI